MYDSYCVVYFKLKFICQSGVWSGAGNSQIVSATATAWRFPSTTAWCPAGKKVVGGGATCSTPGGSIWLVHSLPIGDNGWSGTCDTTQKQNASIVVYATCL
ncbi:shufflon protein B [Salmonella enterica subsp. enterica]|nr:shufflon protein B [Salmonella enterica subsp. enterica serovar Muenchen]ECU4356160.1 shufflon protein B [Salmonella enterica subsp. enterica serovar Braenderup]